MRFVGGEKKFWKRFVILNDAKSLCTDNTAVQNIKKPVWERHNKVEFLAIKTIAKNTSSNRLLNKPGFRLTNAWLNTSE
jgi:hypothetical protein